MDNEQARRFFLQPTQSMQRHYEILRGYFVEQRTLAVLADTHGMNFYTIRALVRRFRDQCQHGQVPPSLWSPTSDAQPGHRTNLLVPKRQKSPMPDCCD